LFNEGNTDLTPDQRIARETKMIDIEAQRLAEEFLASKKKEVNPEPSASDSPNVLVLVPCHTGDIKAKTVLSLLNMMTSMRRLITNLDSSPEIHRSQAFGISEVIE
jgi:hypothetical protein